jgi:flagellar hook-associated protein 3 FlgL
LHKSQSKYAETNQRIASGNRFTKLSDDVSAGSRVLRSRMDRYKAQKQLENAQEANAKLKVTEDNMMSMNQILTTVHENKVVRALNDPTSDQGRAILASEIRSMMAEFLQYANASYGKMFSYGGTNASSAPFTVDSGTGKLLYNGVDMDSITRDPVTGLLMAGGAEVPMDKDIYFDIGLGVIMSGPEVNEATAFKVSYSGPEVLGFGVDSDGVSNNIYNVMNEIQKHLDINDEGFDREEVEKWNTKLRSLMDTFRVNLTDIGTKTNFLDAMEQRLKDTIDNHTEKIQTLMGVKDEEEATNQMMNDYVLKAVLQLGSRVLPLSLMDFIR